MLRSAAIDLPLDMQVTKSSTLPAKALTSCIACAKAKRRCSKDRPVCLECWSRSQDCKWPKPKPSKFVRLEAEEVQNTGTSLTLPPRNQLTTVAAQVIQPWARGTVGEISRHSAATARQQLGPWWFTSPETWQIEHPPSSVIRRHRSADDRRLAIATVFAWLERWVDGDCNPFIHQQLYRQRFPQCIQDAYMSLSCYLKRKPSNEDTVVRIIDERSQQLVSVWGTASDAMSNTEDIVLSIRNDPLGQLARVQALLIYQLIGMYDGDIRLRALADRHIDVLLDWTHRAVVCASSHEALGVSLQSSKLADTWLDDLPWEVNAWQSWILAESLRRTCLLVSAMQGLYLSNRDGVGRCLGGMMCTFRAGFWEATSAQAWLSKCSDTYGGLVHLTETEKLLRTIPLGEIDEFAYLILQVTFGADQMERWGSSHWRSAV